MNTKTEAQRMAEIMGVDPTALSAAMPAQPRRFEALALGFSGTHFDPQRRADAAAGPSPDVQTFAARMGVDAQQLQARMGHQYQAAHAATKPPDAEQIARLMGVDPAALLPAAAVSPAMQKALALAAQIERMAQDMERRRAQPQGTGTPEEDSRRAEIFRLMGCTPDQHRGA